MTKEELQAVYFGFYDKLNEPERSQAKENWDWELAKNHMPDSTYTAVNSGFYWTELNQSLQYWSDIYEALANGTYHTKSNSNLTLTINSLTDSEVTAYMSINNELRKAEAKHPEFPVNMFEQLAIITEELGEVAQALNDQDKEQAKKELHQVGAMVIRMLKNWQ